MIYHFQNNCILAFHNIGAVPPHLEIRLDIYIADTNKSTKDDNYSWLDKDR